MLLVRILGLKIIGIMHLTNYTKTNQYYILKVCLEQDIVPLNHVFL